MFGEESVPKIFQGDRIYVNVDKKKAYIDLAQVKVNIEVNFQGDRIYMMVEKELMLLATASSIIYLLPENIHFQLES